ncbi:MAG: DUF3500 domain-containing protein [Planctomycetaceae bacterium]
MEPNDLCPDCQVSLPHHVTRRRFVQTIGAAAALASPIASLAKEADPKKPQSETLVKKLYDTFTEVQKKELCFDWDHTDERGVLRTHVNNNWQITDKFIATDFFTKDQQDLIEAIYFGLYNVDWHDRIRTQLRDDAGGYGKHQSIALFGQPGTGKFEFVMTGRHLTIRCDGDTTEHVAFGGPIFYGHAAKGFNERADHPGNVYWPQAVKANALFSMLDGRQREKALIAKAPAENEVLFRGKKETIPGLPVSELSKDQREHTQGVLQALLEPYRQSDRDEAARCLAAQGGLDDCRLAFYKSGDIGDDGVWDIWRLEGPSFVWHFRGSPHVHVWVNVADDPSVKITAG